MSRIVSAPSAASRSAVLRSSQRPIRSVSLVIPCYNESGGLEKLREKLNPLVADLCGLSRPRLIFVDDGSSDSTHASLQKLFASYPDATVDITQHPRNLGLSKALQTGARLATSDVVCTLDSDCTYDPIEVLGLLELMSETDADIVTGSPYHPDGGVENVQGWRLALSRTASRMYSAVLPEKLYCYTSMFRAYRREWFRPEWLTAGNFVGVAEILARAMLAGAHVVEYPVVLRRRQYGVSKMRVGRAAFEHLKLMSRLAASDEVAVKPENGAGVACSDDAGGGPGA